MAEEEKKSEETPKEAAPKDAPSKEAPASEDLKLDQVFAFKEGMTNVFSEKGENIPVTVLRWEPITVSQVKTKEKDNYQSLQLSFCEKRASRTKAAEKGHLKKSGFPNGAMFTREVRKNIPEGVAVGAKVSLASLAKGDNIKVTARSKGRGFAGVMKRWGFSGGKASHGADWHRKGGSIGNCEFPGRVMKGKKMPGHFGHAMTTVKNLTVVDVLEKDNVILVKGAVPGPRRGLVQITKI